MIRFPHASARWWQRSLMFMLLLPLAAVRHSPAVTAAPEVPSGLSAADWQTIQAQLPMAPSAGLSTQQAYLKASNTGASDRFGYSVAVAGDTIVVGANAEASNATGVNGNQADNSGAAPNGTGLGLAISHGIVTAHGGRIWAENRPSGGASFKFALPIMGEPPKEVISESPYARENRHFQ